MYVVLSSGCTVSKRANNTGNEYPQVSTEEILQVTENQNITSSSFFIEKGKITSIGDDGRIKLLFTMKYTQPGNFLISLKGLVGVEAFRIFLTKDTVLINDRIKQQTLYGKPRDFEKLSGLPAELLKLCIGDFFKSNNNYESDEYCKNNSLKVKDYFQGLIINSSIDCKLGKTRWVTLGSGLPNESLKVSYSKFSDGVYKVPKRIEVNDLMKNVKIVIKIDKYTVPWTDKIEFIQGRGYKLKKLL